MPCCLTQVNFSRSKGHAFEVFSFKTSVTPDADAMVRCAAVSVVRLMVRCGAFRAQYVGLSQARHDALVAAIEGAEFRGIELQMTIYESFEAMVGACAKDRWVLHRAARGRALVPHVRPDGSIDVKRTFDKQKYGRLTTRVGVAFGMNPQHIGLWSLRKMAAERAAHPTSSQARPRHTRMQNQLRTRR